MMFYSSEARKQITEASEGLRLTAYPDPGTGGAPWTIAYGHTDGVSQGDTCTAAEADAWLEEDLSGPEDEVNSLIKVPLTQSQFDALVDFCFNVGSGNLERSTLLRKLNAGDMAGADAEFSKWVFGGGHRLPGLVARREKEANWFNTGAV
ncbi:lysozyme [Oxalobacteraceae bacterium GrIS 2.11]